MEGIIILLLALAIDLVLGEFPPPIHPVVWMGKAISFLEGFAPAHKRGAQLVYGAFMALMPIFIFALPVYFLLLYASKINLIVYLVLGALALKSTFAFRELRQVAFEVKELLTKDKIEEARAMMSALVSRENRSLGKPTLVSATVESVTENTCDSFVAPLFYFLLLGVPGAVAYRAVNTIDAMIGYHGKYEYLGKFAARLDDLLNFIPARLTALLLAIAAYLCRGDGKKAWRIMLRDHGKTESPNAGWPMSAMAGALRMQLEKRDHYVLGDSNNPLSPQLITAGIKLFNMSSLLWIILCLMTEITLFVLLT